MLPLPLRTSWQCSQKATRFNVPPFKSGQPAPQLGHFLVHSTVARANSCKEAPVQSYISAAVHQVVQRSTQCAAFCALGALWLLGRSAPATAGILPRPSSTPQLETMVAIPPPASVTASVTNPNDSMLMIVMVCLGFYMLSATISAAIGAIMHLSGRSLQYATRGAANWTAAGIMDTFDIMRLPLAYEIEEPIGKGRKSSKGSSSNVVYVPWDGPDASYIPVNMVKVLRPGFLEAGLRVNPALMPPNEELSIISITSSGQSVDGAAQRLPGMANGNGNGNGNGNAPGHRSNGNGNGNGNGRSNGTGRS